MASGIEMMFKSFGIDTSKVMSEFEAFRTGATNTLRNIDQRLARLETILELNTKLLEEITAWKRIQTHQSLLTHPLQPQSPQPQPNPQPSQPEVNQ